MVSDVQVPQVDEHLVQIPYLAKVPSGHFDSVTQTESLKA